MRSSETPSPASRLEASGGPLCISLESFSPPPGFDFAVSRALLERVAAGHEPDSLRIYRPAPMVAFGPADCVSPGYDAARCAAEEHGFAAIERLAGGRAAVYHEGTIAFAWTVREEDARARVLERFALIAGILAEALRNLGIDARIGEVPGEYCPGAYSINARGETKIAGVGQRIVRGAAHVGGVIVVDGAERVSRVLGPVNEALGIKWDARAVGSVADERANADWDDVVDTIRGAFAGRYELLPAPLSPETLARARSIAGLDTGTVAPA